MSVPFVRCSAKKAVTASPWTPGIILVDAALVKDDDISKPINQTILFDLIEQHIRQPK